MKNLVFFISIFFTCNCSHAQNLLSSYPMPTGYSNTQLRARNAFHADAADYKWVGFNTIGLGRFDSSSWIMFDSLNSTLPSNRIFSLASNSATLWVGTLAGLSKYNGTTFTNFDSTNSPLPSDGVYSLATIGNTVWVGTNHGLYKYDGTNWFNFTIANSGIINDTVQCITPDPSGDVWIGTKNGLSYFANNSFTNYTSGNSSLQSNSILSITITNANNVWIGTNGTDAYRFLNGDFISLYELLYPNFQSCQSVFNYSTYSIGKDANNNVYFLNQLFDNPKSIIKVTPSGKVFKCLLQDTSNSFQPVSSMLMQTSHNGTLWLSKKYPPFSFSPSKIYSLDLINLSSTLILPGDSFDLNINEVTAGITNRGDLHYVLGVNRYNVPACTRNSTVYASALWLGGYDQSSNLHVAAMTYRQTGIDFWPGPLDTITGTADSTSSIMYDRLWKVDKSMLYNFQQNFLNGNVSNGTYPIPELILSWPAHGDGNHSRKLAPFVDYNSDGVYSPYDGDYPEITGDQMLWWVFNDTLASHAESEGAAFGFEIHGKAYAYACPAVSTAVEAINYTTLYQYKIINRSPNTYHNMYIGLWCDFDLGFEADDFIGCDTMLDAGFAYNGDNHDEGAGGYGFNPPMQSVTILKGPLAIEYDGNDNNHNGTIDEAGETIGMSHFMTYHGSNFTPTANPQFAHDYYSYLNGLWLNGLPLTYGGGGYDPNGIPTNFFYPGTPYDTGWTEINEGNIPEDRRGLMSSGPFTIAPGEEQTIDFAYVYTRDSTAPNGLTTSIAKNKADLIKVRQWFNTNSFPSCFNFNLIDKPPVNHPHVYPNPATTLLHLKTDDAKKNPYYIIMEITGRICLQGVYKDGIDVSKLKTQLYLLHLNDGIENSYTKFVKW